MTESWLHAKLTEVIPTEAELRTVREALDKVATCLEREGGALRIAERHPCGSYEKKTMLTGRREADLVVVLREAPTDRTLADLKAVLERETAPISCTIHHKAVALVYANDAKVDVLPVAKEGVTEPSTAVPAKLRHALSGPKHVQWFREKAHETAVHPTVRLLKLFRDRHSGWKALGSFAIELLAVDLLNGFQEDLEGHFTKALREIADGALTTKVLRDPARSSNDLLGDLTPGQRTAIAETARWAVKAIDKGSWSSVFQSPSDALPVSNLGGRTLA